MFVVAYPALRVLNVMRLRQPAHRDPVRGHLQRADHPRADPAGAARREVRPRAAPAILRRNPLIYGVGGIIAPFVFIKLIDLLLTAMGLH